MSTENTNNSFKTKEPEDVRIYSTNSSFFVSLPGRQPQHVAKEVVLELLEDHGDKLLIMSKDKKSGWIKAIDVFPPVKAKLSVISQKEALDILAEIIKENPRTQVRIINVHGAEVDVTATLAKTMVAYQGASLVR